VNFWNGLPYFYLIFLLHVGINLGGRRL
jgi:hypothetical protein